MRVESSSLRCAGVGARGRRRRRVRAASKDRRRTPPRTHHRLASGRRAVPTGRPIVAPRTQGFERSIPAFKVNVQYQTWGDHLRKFDATLAGGNVPDVIEMGNTEMTKYMAAGAFTTHRRSPRSRTAQLAQGPRSVGTFNGKLYGVPYYAGSRVVTYRTDLFKRPRSRSRGRSASSPQARKLRAQAGDRTFSPVYIAGTDWYFAMGFVYDYGGQIASPRKGRWQGTLDRPRRGPAWPPTSASSTRLAGEQDDDRDPPEPVRRLRAGTGGEHPRPGLVQLLRRARSRRSPRSS